MSKIKFWLAALSLAIMAGLGCQKQNPVQAPANEENVTAAQIAAEFEATLETEIQSLNKTAGGVTEIAGPTVITASGVYKVRSDFSATADAIVIKANRVVLDLGERAITGPGNKSGRGIVLDGATHVIVRNGNLKTFGVGVAVLGSSRTVVKNVKVQGGDEFADPPNGIPPQIGILLVNSYQNLIFNNTYRKINLGIFVRGGGSHDNYILHNSAVGGAHGLLGICYNPAGGQGPAGPTNDQVLHNFLNRFGVGIQASSGSAQNHFNRNTIYYFNKAWEDFNGTNAFRENRTMQITP